MSSGDRQAQPHRLHGGGGSIGGSRCVSPSTAPATRATPATRWLRRCWRMASIWSGAASSITARAASSAPAPRSRTRWCSWAAARAPSPTSRATQVELYDGLTAASQNCWPSVRFDLWALNDVLGPLFPAGFYYKTFMWPQSWWRSVYERLIRRAAGLGRAPTEPDPDRYEHMHAHCDVLVVGAGPAGLMAALAAGRSGARVILVDEQPELGGALLSEPSDHPGAAWLRCGCGRARDLRRATRAHAHHGVRLLRSQFPRAARAGDRSSSCRCRAASAPPAPVEGAGPAGRAGHRRARATSGVRGQRPAGHHAGERRAHLRQPVRGAARPARRGVHQQRQRLSHRARPAARRGRRERDRPARQACGQSAGRGARRRHQRAGRPCDHRDQAGATGSLGPGAPAQRFRRSGGRSGRHDPVRSRVRLGRLEPDDPPAVAVARHAALRRRTCAVPAGRTAPGGTLGRRLQRRVHAARLPRAGRARRARRRGGGRVHGRAAGAAATGRARGGARAHHVAGALRPAAPAQQDVRRPAERRHRRRHPPRARARATARSSTSSATPRPAWAPTRARRQRQCARHRRGDHRASRSPRSA